MGSPAATPQAAEAILRAQLSAQISNAQTDLDNQLAVLRSAMQTATSNAEIGRAQSQLNSLAQLQRRVDRSDTGALVALRAEVGAFVAAVQALNGQVQPGTALSRSAGSAVQQASAASHQAVMNFERDYYERRIFDPYLRFSSAEDEEEYRKREAERQQEIAKADAQGTPEGNLEANKLAIDQLKDAGAHGADKSPDFKPTMERLQKSSDALSSALEHQRQQSATEQATAAPAMGIDPLDSVGAKAPSAKGAAAALIAAGISKPQSDNVGHGINDRGDQSASQVRGG